ncbi:hypothetical protein ASPFODRAFT_281715 [Aspergillus luchuensis CBS 106.47]|uniref:Uncharacterized protein n=1 Tax=Aspergillus luchuensis (strain CBS 106.47) TaxID=1137211 RepID=A0A1M3U1S7_ASPLC|nr:hypothetical protein ASPFODRAFT_281715 [Aspergillus luchuensis CBS 106.47]
MVSYTGLSSCHTEFVAVWSLLFPVCILLSRSPGIRLIYTGCCGATHISEQTLSCRTIYSLPAKMGKQLWGLSWSIYLVPGLMT